MSPVQKWSRLSFIWMFFCSCLPLLFFASSFPMKEGHTHMNHSCVLEKDIFTVYIENRTRTLAKLASSSDMDTENRFIGEHLYTNVKQKNDRCYLMMRVTDIVVTNVLSKLKNESVEEVAFFFTHLITKLSDCKPLEDKEHIESNLKEMKDKLVKLGENGENKIVGEVKMLFDSLEKACTEKTKKSNTKKKN